MASVIGIDLGSHAASIAVWYEEKNMLEVLADDLGFRAIPTVVAFRGDESIVGQSAISQQHKNAANTFDDVRSLLLNKEKTHVNVPILDKDMTVEEINSLFFRNIHNQVKQQAGKAIRDAIVTIPEALDEDTKKKYVEAAQAGGIRIKSFIDDSAAALLAYGLDDPTLPTSKAVIVDLGWSRCTITVYNVSAGLIVPLATANNTSVCGNVFVKLLTDFCAKDFQRKAKFPCADNKRAMIRLFRECENAMKALSTGQEATIDIDSLCEGVDYSSKISRARFEDLISIPFIHFKNLLNEVLSKAGMEADAVNQVLLSGGPSAIPKFMNTLKTILPHALFHRVHFETSEAACLGAAIHGKLLHQQGLLDNAPTQNPTVTSLQAPILIAATADPTNHFVVFSTQTPLPGFAQIPVQFPTTTNNLAGSVFVFVGGASPADAATLLGEVTFTLATALVEGEKLVLEMKLNNEEGLNAQIVKVNSTEKTVVSSLDIALA